MNVECPDQAWAECALVPLLQPRPLLEEPETEQQGRICSRRARGQRRRRRANSGGSSPGLELGEEGGPNHRGEALGRERPRKASEWKSSGNQSRKIRRIRGGHSSQKTQG